ncbi:MAG: alcohol dehydrogenase catalytic domain-containing protein [Phycisphaerae bacterium]|nr:alcohol dehydrogenase catalytic domain-containing protein [Phycisphaerae bacterium]
MKAAYLTGICKVELRDAPEPKLEKPTDVLIDVEVVGMCGSDIHYYRTGRIGEMVVQYPFIVGHEFSGRVLEVGDDVTNVKVGQRVAVDPLMWCQQCDQCRAGREHTCRNQVFLGCPGQVAGCLCERIVMPAASCFTVPDNVSPEQAALAEPFSIGIHTQRLGGEITGKRVGILGAGPIGLCTLASCKTQGVGKVYMTDLLPERVKFAKTFGADWVGNSQSQDVVAEIAKLEPLGLDVVFECAGKQETVDQGVELLAPGGKLVVVGIPEEERTSMIIANARRKEITFQNVRRQNRCVAPAVEMIASGTVQLDSMMTHHFSFDEIPQAFELVEGYKDGVIKAMINIKK